VESRGGEASHVDPERLAQHLLPSRSAAERERLDRLDVGAPSGRAVGRLVLLGRSA